uniref:AAA_28 domain-containing protein n=1 Tax=Parastrongyloides trichosuri TaxID=131310 RepID=A0A0N4Z1C0_PARTI
MALSTKKVLQEMEKLEKQKSTNQIYKVVLTGGPCGGKTTGQERLESFFTSIGWTVLKVPEAATTLMKGGIRFGDLNEKEQYVFQEELVRTLLRLESVYFRLAESFVERTNVLVICDRGAMDPSAYMSKEEWDVLCKKIDVDTFHLRETRYNQIVHMVTAADGAEKFYTLSNNNARSEGIKDALKQEQLTRKAWIGHPYLDVIDNGDCESFEDKILKMIQCICKRIGIKAGDRLDKNTKKRKWLVSSFNEKDFAEYIPFSVSHNYLKLGDNNENVQVRLRKRGNGKKMTYTLTKSENISGERIETIWQISHREYDNFIKLRDNERCTLYKTRRCFNYGNQYFHLDIFVPPLPLSCAGKNLMILETYTTKAPFSDEPELPSFMNVVKEITGNKEFSMYNISKKNSKPLEL